MRENQVTSETAWNQFCGNKVRFWNQKNFYFCDSFSLGLLCVRLRIESRRAFYYAFWNRYRGTNSKNALKLDMSTWTLETVDETFPKNALLKDWKKCSDWFQNRIKKVYKARVTNRRMVYWFSFWSLPSASLYTLSFQIYNARNPGSFRKNEGQVYRSFQKIELRFL